MVPKLHCLDVPAALGPDWGADLLSWNSESAIAVPDAISVPKKKRTTLAPILVVLFLVSYGLLSMLVVEQGRTIDNQRSLIYALFGDSNQLVHMKGDLFQKQRADAQAQALAKDHAQAQTPSNPGSQIQVTPRDNAKPHNSSKLHKALPPKPPAGSDFGDVRRTVMTI